MSEFKQYRRTNIAEMRPYQDGEELDDSVSISKADRENGSPKPGDMIARNPDNHDDKWLVAKAYFEANFAPLGDPNEILKDRTTHELSIHTGSHPDHVEAALDRLKGTDDHAHDVILALFRDLHIARNRAEFFGEELLTVLADSKPA